MHNVERKDLTMIIPPTWTLPEAIKARIGQNTYGHQRAIVEEGHLLLVLHQPPAADESRREGVLFWRNPAGEWQWSRGGPGPGALKRHVQAYGELEAKLAHEYETNPSLTSLFDLMEALTPLIRSAHNMHQALQAARESFKFDGFLIEMRDLAYEVDRNFGLLMEDVKHAIQCRTAREAEEQAQIGREAVRASHRLNRLVALFLPLTAIASIFSMQFKHGLNENDPKIFYIVLILGVSLGLGVTSWVMAKEKEEVRQPPPKV
jgi:CorA-like Mg2+ transporter protein